MNAVTLPGWAYPTREAKRLHYFKAEGEPSLCRRYFAGAVSLMEPLSSQHDLTESKCCATCWRKAPADVEIRRHDA